MLYEVPDFELIAFDADDTLWHNEPFYTLAKTRFISSLSDIARPEEIEKRLDTIEVANLDDFGYGIKSFALSMVQTALDVCNGQPSGKAIQGVIDIAHDMLQAELELFEHAHYALQELSPYYPLMLLTKGDTYEQERKIQRSGLAEYFRYIEITGDKNLQSYQQLLAKYQIPASRFLMIGNSLRSDILPVLELGGKAVFIPYEHTWSHEILGHQAVPGSYYEISHLGELPALLKTIKL